MVECHQVKIFKSKFRTPLICSYVILGNLKWGHTVVWVPPSVLGSLGQSTDQPILVPTDR